MDDKIKFSKTALDYGGSLAITIPPQLIEFLNIKKGDDLTLVGDVGKHGKFIAFFKKESLENNQVTQEQTPQETPTLRPGSTQGDNIHPQDEGGD